MSLFLTNLTTMGAAAFITVIKQSHGMTCDALVSKIYQEMGDEYATKIVTYSNAAKVYALNEEIKEQDYEGKKGGINTILGHKYTFEFVSNDKAYSSYLKFLPKLAKGDLVELITLKKKARKSLLLMHNVVCYTLSLAYPNLDVIYDDFYTEEDKKFMNAFAEYCYPTLSLAMFPSVEAPSIENYFVTRNVDKWDQENIVTLYALELFKSKADRITKYISGPVRRVSSDTEIDENTVVKYRKDKNISPIMPASRINPPAFFANGGDVSMDEKDLPEATRKVWENKIVTPVQINAEKPEVKVEKPKNEFKMPKDIRTPKGFTDDEFKSLVEIFESKYSNKFDYAFRKNDFGTILIDVKNKDGKIITNIVDTGRFAGGKRFSVIGTAVMPNNADLRYPQYIDVETMPEIAEKVLLDDRYHLTEDERIKCKERFATPIVYEWFDFVGTEFINDLNNTDLAQFFYNCFNTIRLIDANNSFNANARLRVIDFVDINNFTVVSDENCRYDYAQFGIKQNNLIIQGLRVDIRNGALLDNSTRIANSTNNVKNVPLNQAANPMQMFNQIQSMGGNLGSVSSGFMPANGNQPTILNDGTFIPNFGIKSVPDLNQGVRTDMTYDEVKALISNAPLSEELFNKLYQIYPGFIERIKAEANAK